MKSHEADEFVKFFKAMDKRFRDQCNFPIWINDQSWILSRTDAHKISLILQEGMAGLVPQMRIYVAKCKEITAKAPVKSFRMSTDRRSFRIYDATITFFSGDNKNILDLGSKRAEVHLRGAATNWVANAQTLLKILGDYDEIRANLADPEILWKLS